MSQAKNTRAGADAVERRNAVVEAFSTLLKPIARNVFHSIGDAASPEDLEQAGALGLIDAATKFEGYARKRIEGAMRDSIRKRDRREAGHARHEEIGLLPDPVGNLFDRSVLLAELYTAITSELTPRQAEVTALQLEGRSGVEIAASLGIRQQTVVTIQRRARVRLQAKLAA